MLFTIIYFLIWNYNNNFYKKKDNFFFFFLNPDSGFPMIFLLEIIYHNHSKLIWTGEDSKMNSKTLIQYFITSANTLHTILQNARISYEFHMNMFYYMKRVLAWISIKMNYSYGIWIYYFQKEFCKNQNTNSCDKYAK